MTDKFKQKSSNEDGYTPRWKASHDEYAAESRDSDFFGPVSLISYEANAGGSIFYVDNPDKLPERAVAARVAIQDTALMNLMTLAYSSHKPVLVAPANRWWLGQNKLAWTIWAAKIV
jgi:hypothetical protein